MKKNCIICEKCESKGHSLISPTMDGVKSLKFACDERKKLFDLSNTIVISQIQSNLEKNFEIVYHKSCYASFTSKSKISRLNSTSMDTEIDVKKDD